MGRGNVTRVLRFRRVAIDNCHVGLVITGPEVREAVAVTSELLSTQLISVRDLNSVAIMNRLDLTGNDRTMNRLPIQGRKEQSDSSNRAQVQKSTATDQERDEKQSTAPSRFTLRVSTRSVFGGVFVFHGVD